MNSELREEDGRQSAIEFMLKAMGSIPGTVENTQEYKMKVLVGIRRKEKTVKIISSTPKAHVMLFLQVHSCHITGLSFTSPFQLFCCAFTMDQIQN